MISIRFNKRKKNRLLLYIESNNIGIYDLTKSFKNITTINAGGKIDVTIYPWTIEKMISLLKYLEENKIKHMIVGFGSNILASDKKYKGVVILGNKIKKEIYIQQINKTKDYLVTASFNISLNFLANYLKEHSLTGGEALRTIPGSVGGLIKMNASCFDYHNEDHLVKALCYENGNVYFVKRKEIGFNYRNTSGNYIFLYGYFIFEKSNKELIIQKEEDYLKQRKEKQPQKVYTFGSTFKNNIKSAGYLIEKVGLKDYYYKGAKVSGVHANFILNKNNAKAKNIYKLMKKIRKKVYKREKIKLENEVVLVQLNNFK